MLTSQKMYQLIWVTHLYYLS